MSFSDKELCRGWRLFLLIKIGEPDRFDSMLEDWQRVHSPGILYECQNKGLTKLAFRKLLILNGAFSVDGSKWERHRRKEERHHGFGRSRRKRRIPEGRLPGHYSNGSEIASQGKRRGSSGACRPGSMMEFQV